MPEEARGLLDRVRSQFDPASWSFDSTRQDGGRRGRRAVKRAAFAVGLGPSLRRVRQAIEPVDAKRGRQEDDNLRRLLAFSLAADANCIDVGASVGAVLEELVRIAPAGRHIAYEPIPLHADELAARFPDVDVRRAAVSNHTGETSFVYVKSRAAYSGLRERTYPGEQTTEELTVKVEALDESLPEGYAPALIKIDVEGAEREVVEGAVTTITRHKPVVVFEHTRGAAEHYETSSEQLFDLLCDRCGLRVFDLDGDGPYSRDGFAQACASGRHWNWVAHR